MIRFIALLIHWPMLIAVDALSKIGYKPHPSELRRLYSENLALKYVNEALVVELHKAQNKRVSLSIGTRASQVVAYLLTRGNKIFQKRYLGSGINTIKRWARRFKNPFKRSLKRVGRPNIDPLIVEWVLKIKRESPRMGSRKLSETLRRMGIRVSEFTVSQILRDHGLAPTNDHRSKWEQWAGKFKDEYWAMDFLFTQLRKGTEYAIFLVVDTYTKEILELKAFEGRLGLTTNWVAWRLGGIFGRLKRRPQYLIHDRDPLFKDQVVRLCAVEEIKEMKTPPMYPVMNAFVERAVQSVKKELLNNIRPETGEELQTLLDEYKTWFNEHRSHETLGGMTPAEFAKGRRMADVARLDEYRDRKLERIEFANGMLNGYRLVEEKRAA